MSVARQHANSVRTSFRAIAGPLSWIGRRGRAAPTPINLALQGGGAHGAFTWGVLDRLLEDGRLRFDAVSGASAGAMNAVVMASGLAEGGPDAARAKLDAFWEAISDAGRATPFALAGLWQTGMMAGALEPMRRAAMDVASRLVSPYQFNPANRNPLRDVLASLVDVKRLRRDLPIELYISATDVATGRARVFETRELSLDAVLASACLPQLQQAVKVGRRHYWDGGFTSNPPILPLVHGGHARDSLIVQLDPMREAGLPQTPAHITERLNNIIFNASLRQEIAAIAQHRTTPVIGPFTFGRQRRARRHRFHHIAAGRHTRGLGPGSKLTPDWDLLCLLRDAGREEARRWLTKHLDAVGRRSTIDIDETFL